MHSSESGVTTTKRKYFYLVLCMMLAIFLSAFIFTYNDYDYLRQGAIKDYRKDSLCIQRYFYHRLFKFKMPSYGITSANFHLQNGRLLKVEFFDEDGQQGCYSISSSMKGIAAAHYKYDSLGRLIEERYFDKTGQTAGYAEVFANKNYQYWGDSVSIEFVHTNLKSQKNKCKKTSRHDFETNHLAIFKRLSKCEISFSLN